MSIDHASREWKERVMRALGGKLTWHGSGYSWRILDEPILKGTGCFLNKENKPQMNCPDLSTLKWKDRIHQRMLLLLDRLRFNIKTERLHADVKIGPRTSMEVLIPAGREGWKSETFPDSELPWKKQELLVWLVEEERQIDE